MGRYYCDYCDVFLTHDSPGARKAHSKGWKHREAVKAYYEDYLNRHPELLPATPARIIIAPQPSLLAAPPAPLPFPPPGLPPLPLGPDGKPPQQVLDFIAAMQAAIAAGKPRLCSPQPVFFSFLSMCSSVTVSCVFSLSLALALCSPTATRHAGPAAFNAAHAVRSSNATAVARCSCGCIWSV